MKITWYQSIIFNALGLSACLLFVKTLNAENVLYEEAELSISPIEAGKPLRLEIHLKNLLWRKSSATTDFSDGFLRRWRVCRPNSSCSL